MIGTTENVPVQDGPLHPPAATLFVSDVLKDPTRLKRGLDELVRQEKELVGRGHGEDDKTWFKKLADLQRFSR